MCLCQPSEQNIINKHTQKIAYTTMLNKILPSVLPCYIKFK